MDYLWWALGYDTEAIEINPEYLLFKGIPGRPQNIRQCYVLQMVVDSLDFSSILSKMNQQDLTDDNISQIKKVISYYEKIHEEEPSKLQLNHVDYMTFKQGNLPLFQIYITGAESIRKDERGDEFTYRTHCLDLDLNKVFKK